MCELSYLNVRDDLLRKNCCSFGFCPNYLPPSRSHQFGQLVQLVSDVEIRDLKVSLGLKILYVLYTT